MMKYAKIMIVVMSLAICAVGWAGDDTVSGDKPAEKGVGLVEDVSGVMNKATALLSGNLEMTMELNKNRPSKDDYTYNALGQRVPKRTATKTGGALHNQ
jgi:hypothetical protein